MYVDSRRPVMDQEYTYKQRFILQVLWSFLDVSSWFFLLIRSRGFDSAYFLLFFFFNDLESLQLLIRNLMAFFIII